MGDISFNQIPINLRVPGQYIEIDNSQAFQGLSGMPVKALVIGQKLAAGTGAALTPYQITDLQLAKNLFGAGSQLANMLEAFKNADTIGTVDVWAIAQVDNGAGAKAAGNISFTGPATAAGTLNLYIGGRLVQVGVASGDSASTIATNTIAAITADADVPVTAAVDGTHTYQVDLTARHKGVEGNYIDVRVNYQPDEATPAGVAATITALSAGSGNPDITAVFTAIGDAWYTDFAVAYSDDTNLAALSTALSDRFGPLKMADGNAYVGLSNTYANLITKGAAYNTQFISFAGLQGLPNPPYELAAAVCAVVAFYSLEDPARPLQTLPLTGLLAPKITDRFTFTERNLLLYGGVSTFDVDGNGTLLIERLITTYQSNAEGAEDPSYLDIETMKTLAYLRFDTRTLIATRYPRYKLADDGTPIARGQAVVTPNVIRATLIARFKLWEENGLVEDIEQFKQDLIVQRNGSDPNRVDALLPPNIINQLMVFAGQMQFRL